jgi:hypothetical protein
MTKIRRTSWTRALACAGALVAAAAAGAAAYPAPAGGSFADDFSSYPRASCLGDGASLGAWTFQYAGYGCTQFGADGAGAYLEEKPKASASLGETHASLALGPAFTAPYAFSAELKTVAQLRTGNPGNAWEVAWLIWDYTDDTHFYYLTVKPNGWELGKEDPAYRGAQRFLASGPSPAIPVGMEYTAKIEQTGNTLSAFINGRLVATFTDTERPYSAGRIGLYNEDSQVRFRRVSVTPAAGGVAVNPPPAPAPAPAPAPSPRPVPKPAPAVAALSPQSATASGVPFNPAVDGANFTPGSYVEWNGVRVPGVVQGPSRIVAYVARPNFVSPGIARVTVVTPGAPPSNAAPFVIKAKS